MQPILKHYLYTNTSLPSIGVCDYMGLRFIIFMFYGRVMYCFVTSYYIYAIFWYIIKSSYGTYLVEYMI